MLSESGIGVDPMMQQVLDSLRNPEDDPQMRAALDAYDFGNTLQSEANVELANISKLMAEQTEETAATKLTNATTDVALSYNDKRLDDINNGIKDLIVEVKRTGGWWFVFWGYGLC